VVEHGAFGRRAIGDRRPPRRNMRIPEQRVAAQTQPVRRRESGERIGPAVVGRTRGGDDMPFLRVLADDDAGFAPHQRDIGGIGEMARLQGSAETQPLCGGERIEAGSAVRDRFADRCAGGEAGGEKCTAGQRCTQPHDERPRASSRST
jgi:hypothetical protein